MGRRSVHRTDITQPSIVSALRDVGAEVWIIEKPVDLLVAFRGRFHLIEVKSSEADANNLRTSTAQRQREHMARAEQAGCRIHYAWTPEMALTAIGAIK